MTRDSKAVSDSVDEWYAEWRAEELGEETETALDKARRHWDATLAPGGPWDLRRWR